MKYQPINNVYQVIGGYNQSEGADTGMHKLWRCLGRLRSPDTVVSFREWNSPWDKVANNIVICTGTKPQKIVVIAYSWGAGYGFIKFAKELALRGAKIKAAILCDPIYRGGNFLLWGLAYVPRVPITIPWNVENVYGLRQKMTKLSGHSIIAEDDNLTKIHPFIERRRGHTYMDEDPEFHKMVFDLVGIDP